MLGNARALYRNNVRKTCTRSNLMAMVSGKGYI